MDEKSCSYRYILDASNEQKRISKLCRNEACFLRNKDFKRFCLIHSVDTNEDESSSSNGNKTKEDGMVLLDRAAYDEQSKNFLLLTSTSQLSIIHDLDSLRKRKLRDSQSEDIVPIAVQRQIDNSYAQAVVGHKERAKAAKRFAKFLINENHDKTTTIAIAMEHGVHRLYPMKHNQKKSEEQFVTAVRMICVELKKPGKAELIKEVLEGKTSPQGIVETILNDIENAKESNRSTQPIADSENDIDSDYACVKCGKRTVKVTENSVIVSTKSEIWGRKDDEAPSKICKCLTCGHSWTTS